uniref:Fibronectin type-III domain-containing protein n=1 Tax=Macrostomum lignano TaxID=282301 RepID=A0A1I8IGN8_9PLAT
REVRRRWLLIDNLSRGVKYEIRVVMLTGSASAVYTESMRVRTGGSGGDGSGLLKASTATWLGSVALLLLLFLLGTALVFYCLARRRGRHGGRQGGDYHRGKPVATSTAQEAASGALAAASPAQDDCGEFTGTQLHCMRSPQQQQFAHRLSPEGSKSYAFTDTSYLTLGNHGNEKLANFGVTVGCNGGAAIRQSADLLSSPSLPTSR